MDRTTPPHILTLVVASAVGAVAMNIFIPSLPGMAAYFDADYRVAQLAVSLYLAATAVLQLVIGPASDRYGRRPVMLVSMVIFGLATLGCLFSPSIEILLAFRVMQATGAAGIVLGRAIVRDTVDPDRAASKIGYITMGMAMAPMVAPAVGGLLDQIYGWKATFILTFLLGLIATAIIYFDLGETNRHKSSSMTAQMRSYPELVRSRRFWGYAMTAAFTSGMFFAFLGGGPYVASVILGMRPAEYGVYFGLVSLGYVLGNFISGRFAAQYGLNVMMLAGNAISALGVAAGTLLFAFEIIHPLSLFAPVAIVGIGNGMTLPSAMSGLVSVRPHLAGSASGLGGTLQIGGGAALAVIAGAVLSPSSGALPLLLVMLLSALAAVACSLYVMHVARLAAAGR